MEINSKEIISKSGTEPTCLHDFSVNHCILDQNYLYFNIVNPNDNTTRNIYYLDDFTQSSQDKILKVLPIFDDESYLFNFELGKIFILTKRASVRGSFYLTFFC